MDFIIDKPIVEEETKINYEYPEVPLDPFPIIPIVAIKQEPAPKVEEFLKLKKEISQLKNEIGKIREENKKNNADVLQHAVDICYSSNKEFFNQQTEEINKTLFSKMLFKLFNVAIIVLNKKARKVK